MRIKQHIASYFLILVILAVITSCGGGLEKDDSLPEISMSEEDDFPLNCDTIYRGQNFVFHATFTDNVELGAYSIDIHNNFNHHTHSTDIVECKTDAVKTPVDPFIFLEEYEIPAKQTIYEATVSIDVPADIDNGDYHFLVRLTDASGWQVYKGISIKIVEAE